MVKKRLPFIAMLLSSLLLTGCGDKGFSAVRHTDEFYDYNAPQEPDNPDNNPPQGGGASTGFDPDKNENEGGENEQENHETTPTENGEQVTTQDLGERKTTFLFDFVSIGESKYVYASFENDPLEEKFNFSYYTVDDKKVENQLIEKVDLDSKKCFKINLETTNKGRYTIAFYNKKNEQYGVAHITIVEQTTTTSYLSVAFGVAQIQLATIGYNIMIHLQKIGDFFSGLLQRDTVGIYK